MTDAQRAEPIDTERFPRRDVVSDLREQGYTTTFEVAEGGRVHCGDCDADLEPEDLEVHDTHRYEGNTNPGDEELILAVSCPEGHRGTLTLAYGPYATPDGAEVARRLPRAD